jgi:hypothetical protein
LKVIPIMAVTAYAAKGDAERIREAGAEGYVSKPISVVRFVEAVGALLEQGSEPDIPKVDSSAVDRVEYVAETATLAIWYNGGERDNYLGVPPDVYQSLLDSESIGAFLDNEIKPHYRFEPDPRRVRPED